MSLVLLQKIKLNTNKVRKNTKKYYVYIHVILCILYIHVILCIYKLYFEFKLFFTQMHTNIYFSLKIYYVFFKNRKIFKFTHYKIKDF